MEKTPSMNEITVDSLPFTIGVENSIPTVRTTLNDEPIATNSIKNKNGKIRNNAMFSGQHNVNNEKVITTTIELIIEGDRILVDISPTDDLYELTSAVVRNMGLPVALTSKIYSLLKKKFDQRFNHPPHKEFEPTRSEPFKLATARRNKQKKR
eukprot:TRINITY_DN2612_c0_g1_i2.p1 TRINITY_DN2612_c0_g1~~TRINITY_DN2612_c0_g1_i2.p1  ORF type:complete len:153 (-),score=37.55 TRINITY_DN2612_c0_g1_i2:504-962(-)